MVAEPEPQRIARLTPLADVLDSLQTSVDPVAPFEAEVGAATGLTLAADAVVAQARPATALALRDGYALRAEATADAGAYAPAPLDPPPQRIDTGEPLPDGCDAVAPIESVAWRGARAEALAPLAPGDGVLGAAADATAGTVLRLAGARLRRIDVAVLAGLGLSRVSVREPSLGVVRAATGAAIGAAAGLVAAAIAAEGGHAVGEDAPLDRVLAQAGAGQGPDAIVAIGGTGSGRHDSSVALLARHGRVAAHGIAIRPGETSALGFAGSRPVLLLPGRLDAALAGWLLLGRRLFARLAFRLVEDQPFSAELSRKVASPLGLAEVVPVRRRAGTVEPLPGGYLAAQILARADGWILVPADSEGFAPGARVAVRPWP